jgi:hypothetical protein
LEFLLAAFEAEIVYDGSGVPAWDVHEKTVRAVSVLCL